MSHYQLDLDLTLDERAKFHSLGGASWLRLQIQNAPTPTTGLRPIVGLTQKERESMLLYAQQFGVGPAARKYRVKTQAIYNLRGTRK